MDPGQTNSAKRPPEKRQGERLVIDVLQPSCRTPLEVREVAAGTRVVARRRYLQDPDAGLTRQELAAFLREVGFFKRHPHLALLDDVDQILQVARCRRDPGNGLDGLHDFQSEGVREVAPRAVVGDDIA